MSLWVVLPGLGRAAEPGPPSLETRPLSAQEKRYHKRLLAALEKMAAYDEEGRRTLSHLLEEARLMSGSIAHPVQFEDLGKAWGACPCFQPDVRHDFIRMHAGLLDKNPYLAYGAWVHQLQHRYDKRLQRELFRGTLYTLEYEKRALKAEAIAFGLARKAGKVRPGGFQPGPETEYSRHVQEVRQALQKGEASPGFIKLAESCFSREAPFRPAKVEEAGRILSRLSQRPRTPGNPAEESELRIARFEMERGTRLKVPPEDFPRLQALPGTGPGAPGGPPPGMVHPGTQTPVPPYPAVEAPGMPPSPSTAPQAGWPPSPLP